MPERRLFTGTPTSSATEAYYGTLLHELTHWTGAKTRCARDLTGRFGSQAYAMEELVAELGSAFLSAASSASRRYPGPPMPATSPAGSRSSRKTSAPSSPPPARRPRPRRLAFILAEAPGCQGEPGMGEFRMRNTQAVVATSFARGRPFSSPGASAPLKRPGGGPLSPRPEARLRLERSLKRARRLEAGPARRAGGPTGPANKKPRRLAGRGSMSQSIRQNPTGQGLTYRSLPPEDTASA